MVGLQLNSCKFCFSFSSSIQMVKLGFRYRDCFIDNSLLNGVAASTVCIGCEVWIVRKPASM